MSDNLEANVLRLGAEVRDLSISNAVLRQENEELHKDYEALADEHTKLIERNKTIKAEVERLYRHGDLMLKFAAANMPYPAYVTFAKDWLAAKEGKPTEQKSPSFIEDLGNGVEKHDLLFRYPAKEGKQS